MLGEISTGLARPTRRGRSSAREGDRSYRQALGRGATGRIPIKSFILDSRSTGSAHLSTCLCGTLGTPPLSHFATLRSSKVMKNVDREMMVSDISFGPRAPPNRLRPFQEAKNAASKGAWTKTDDFFYIDDHPL